MPESIVYCARIIQIQCTTQRKASTRLYSSQNKLYSSDSLHLGFQSGWQSADVWIRPWSTLSGASLVIQTVKNMPAVQETRLWSLDWEDPLEKGMATHSSILSWRIPCTEEPGKLQSTGHKESVMTSTFTFSPLWVISIFTSLILLTTLLEWPFAVLLASLVNRWTNFSTSGLRSNSGASNLILSHDTTAALICKVYHDKIS